MSNSVDYLIVGAGPVGLTAAIAMKQKGFSVAVMDKQALDIQRTSTARAYAINQASHVLFSSLDIWSHISEEKISAYEKMYVWDPLGKGDIHFDCRERGCSELGFIIDELTLKKALYEKYGVNPLPALQAHDLVERDDHVLVNACDAEGIEHVIRANFVIITDGAHSTLRKQLQVPLTQWPYHHHATVATVRTEKSHEKTAYQIFTKEGPLAFLPLPDTHLCSIVWSTSPDYAKQICSWSEDEFNRKLAETFENKLGACTLVNQRMQFPLQMRHVEQYHGKRWILMGDAAHTIHPLAGLGLNLGLADLHTWLHLIQKKSPDISVLGAYQRQRKSEVWAVIGLMEMIKRTFLVSSGPLPHLRGLSMSILNKVTPLKRLMMDYACGRIPHTKSGTTPP
jgi:2-polyprenylphenol 6-hydroxylase